MIENPYHLDLDVHGGITYGKYNTLYPIETMIESFWLGFDCAHYDDGKDMELIKELASEVEYNHTLRMNAMFDISDESSIRTTEYVESELKSLVNQLLAQEQKLIE